MNTVVDWRAFVSNRPDSYGMQHKFEALCRQLFVEDIIIDPSDKIYLHSNPNNPGLESEPIYDSQSDKRLGYQVKFFENAPDYSQIKDSVTKILKYYSGQVDVVYLFCNKPLTSSSYADSVQLLKQSSIDLIPITDEHVLDMVRKHPYLANYYFGCHWLTEEWLDTQLAQSLDSLGNRYNKQFNVDTISSGLISLFAIDQRAADQINQKKWHLLKRIDSYRFNPNVNRSFLQKLRAAVCLLRDVSPITISDSMHWFDQIKAIITDELAVLEKQKESAEQKISELLLVGNQEKIVSAHSSEMHRLRNDIELYNDLISLVYELSLSKNVVGAITKKVLIVRGIAGTGKTQLFSHEAAQLKAEGVVPILLLGEKYLSDTPIKKQIIEDLEVNCSFEELIQMLNVIGIENKRPVTVFIDALNETWNSTLWKNDLCSMIHCIEKTQFVKLAISYRDEFEELILPETLKENGDIFRINHDGFATDGYRAIREFITSYGISFSPVEYFNQNLTNPLFLSLYCRTYDGSEIDIQTLYNRIIKNANDSVMRMADSALRHLLAGDSNNIARFVNEFAARIVESNQRSISLEEISQMHFWNESGLSMRPVVNALVNEGLLNRFCIKSKEYVQFSYDQMNDYYCAKYLVQKHSSFESLMEYIGKAILKTPSGDLRTEKQGLFLNMAALIETQFDKDVLIVADSIHEDDHRQMLIDDYLDSYKWRGKESVTQSRVSRLLKQYHFSRTTLWEVLIANSLKEKHALNADMLNKILKPMTLTHRDQVWTTYINHLGSDDYVMQLQEALYAEEAPGKMTDEQIRLLLILQSWMLTSTNRYLRDITSKAMIELMKDNFWSCRELLMLFNDVNDPYIIQRLYGIVFGVCCKSQNKDREQYRALAEDVYNYVFVQEYVYPDILLRDYAKLIVDKFLWDNPDYTGIIDINKTIPPYRSEALPLEVEHHDLEKSYEEESYSLVHSMRFDGMGMYGDFGRYVFQRALGYFDVGDKHQAIHDYALHFIFNVIGYTKSLFGDYERNIGYYSISRSESAKVERIGKKYQWIAFYNIMARISDCYKIKDGYGDDAEEKPYLGAWEPYVRDFDPTLNYHFAIDPQATIIKSIEMNYLEANAINQTSYGSTEFNPAKWLSEDSAFFSEQPNTLVTSMNGVTWITLEKIQHTDSSNLDICRLYDWCKVSGYFVTPDLTQSILTTPPTLFYINELTHQREEYVLFNREYPWSSASRSIEQDNVYDIDVLQGQETITDTIHDDGWLTALYSTLDDTLSDAIPYEQTYTHDIRKTLGKALRASLSMRWEEEYDASKGETQTHYVPCADILLKMGLTQNKHDFSYYDQTGCLAAYETSHDAAYSALVIRKDILEDYLHKTQQCLVWFMQGAREIHDLDRSIAESSDRIAVWYYDDGKVAGKLIKLPNERT